MGYKFWGCVLLSLMLAVLFYSFLFRSWQHSERIRYFSDIEDDKVYKVVTTVTREEAVFFQKDDIQAINKQFSHNDVKANYD